MAARCRGFASSLHPYCSEEFVSSPEVRMFIFCVSAPETQRGNLEIALFHETSSTTMDSPLTFPGQPCVSRGEGGAKRRMRGGAEGGDWRFQVRIRWKLRTTGALKR